ncbi:MAG: hypothetical protein LZ172_05440 [Thaumarchaeota archaeon]|nr:hypothetical protein [Candidatus Geocrenenecus arthurdayi]MCL7403770.1 hypothetical protein [Candidatus Geocrenenecus arthurdayi]
MFGGSLVLIGVYSSLVNIVESRHTRDTGIVKTFKQLARFFEECNEEVVGGVIEDD